MRSSGGREWHRELAPRERGSSFSLLFPHTLSSGPYGSSRASPKMVSVCGQTPPNPCHTPQSKLVRPLFSSLSCQLPLSVVPKSWPTLHHSYHQAPSNEATHEPNLQAEVAAGPGGLPIRYQQEGVGHDADEGERDEREPQAASTLPSAHV